MLTPDQIRDELIRQLDDGRAKAADVAALLRIAPPRVSEMRRKARKVQDNEMVPLAQYLNMIEAGVRECVRGVVAVPILGKLAVGVWVERGRVAPAGFTEFDITDGTQNGEGLFAMIADGDAMNVRFPPGTTIICREVESGDTWLDTGTYVVVSRQRDDLIEYSCKKVERLADGSIQFLNESTDPSYSEPLRRDPGVQVLGRVIRAYQSYD